MYELENPQTPALNAKTLVPTFIYFLSDGNTNEITTIVNNFVHKRNEILKPIWATSTKHSIQMKHHGRCVHSSTAGFIRSNPINWWILAPHQSERAPPPQHDQNISP